ncbi:hypothetical protein [Paenibacillus cymbidii]|uniref:hypothetical protein n=1 Tax=Paenibacillus cymbidii TaxID=1639034 RepID=UPI00107FE47E|nr:hypothetical protein [Paenibacillus cymbidii]
MVTIHRHPAPETRFHEIAESGSAIAPKLAVEHRITEGDSVITPSLPVEHRIAESGSAIAPMLAVEHRIAERRFRYSSNVAHRINRDDPSLEIEQLLSLLV